MIGDDFKLFRPLNHVIGDMGFRSIGRNSVSLLSPASQTIEGHIDMMCLVGRGVKRFGDSGGLASG